MNYELAKELKDAGFPQGGRGWVFSLIDDGPEYDEVWTSVEYPSIQTKSPTLSELIEACGEGFWQITAYTDRWEAAGTWSDTVTYQGSTPEEAVAMLYLKLHGKK